MFSIGGLGFGFTARATLTNSRVRKLTVVERLGLVIEWHRAGLLPWSVEFISDPRLTILHDDFFGHAAGRVDSPYHAILIDIDDSPSLLWHDSHAGFYQSTGLETVRERLAPGGVLALWCATHPGEAFVATAEAAFATANVIEIHFENPCLRQPETNYILLATAHNREKPRNGENHSVS